MKAETSHKDSSTGAARSSSVRGVNCSLKWGNERNPCCLLYVSDKTAPLFVCKQTKRITNLPRDKYPNNLKIESVCLLFLVSWNFSLRLCAKSGEEGGDDVRSAWPFDALGYTRGTMARTMGREAARRSQSHQNAPQFRLESATRLHEVGIASKRGSAMPR